MSSNQTPNPSPGANTNPNPNAHHPPQGSTNSPSSNAPQPLPRRVVLPPGGIPLPNRGGPMVGRLNPNPNPSITGSSSSSIPEKQSGNFVPPRRTFSATGPLPGQQPPNPNLNPKPTPNPNPNAHPPHQSHSHPHPQHAQTLPHPLPQPRPIDSNLPQPLPTTTPRTSSLSAPSPNIPTSTSSPNLANSGLGGSGGNSPNPIKKLNAVNLNHSNPEYSSPTNSPSTTATSSGGSRSFLDINPKINAAVKSAQRKSFTYTGKPLENNTPKVRGGSKNVKPIKLEDLKNPDEKTEHDKAFIKAFTMMMEAVAGGYGSNGSESDKATISSLEQKLIPTYSKSKLLAPSKTIKLVENVVDVMNRYLDYERYMRSIIITQKMIRGRRARKHHNKMKIYLTAEMKRRNIIFRELRKSEAAIVLKLEVLVGRYMLPLRESANTNKAIISKQDVQTIFGNLENVLNFHRKLKEGFDKLRDDFPLGVDNIGDVFLKQSVNLKAYGEYVENFDAAVNHVNFLKEQQGDKGKFPTFLSETFAKVDFGGYKLGLLELLGTPLTQASEYEMRLEALMTNTPPDHPGFDVLASACSLMRETNKYVKEAFAHSQNRVAVLQVQRKLDSHEIIQKKGRTFVTESECKEITYGKNKVKHAHMFLFNDILLITTEKSKEKYKVVEELNLTDNILVEDSTDPKVKNTFDLTIAGVKYSITMNSPDEKYTFYHQIQKEIQNHNNKVKVFGVPFKMVADREGGSGIPFIVESICSFLSSKLDTDGMFRISASVPEVKQLVTLFDTGLGNTIEYPKQNPHALCALLKTYFRELPEPIFTFDLYEPLLTVADFPWDDRKTKIQALLSSLPPDNIKLLKYIVQFLNNVSKNSDVNRMTIPNLAIVFGPNLLRPRVDSIETSLNIPKVTIVVEDIIKQMDYFFN